MAPFASPRCARVLAALAWLASLASARPASARNLLVADGPGATYELLKTAYTVEVPDCGHMVDHITEEHDSDLGRNVFVFQLHVGLDDDRCGATDRQRAEIRAKASDIVALEGETVHYAWKFKLDARFQGSPNFTHIMQIKSDESAPVMTLTPRVDSIAIDGRIGEHGKTDLAPFLGAWVRAALRVRFGEDGEVAMTIDRISDGKRLFDYTGPADTWDADASGHDSKFGLYRSLNSADQLRDEQVRFADFCASKVSADECASVVVPEPGGGAGGAPGTAGAPSAGGALPVAGAGGSMVASGGVAGTPVTMAAGAAGAPAMAGGATVPVDGVSADGPEEAGACACAAAGQSRRAMGRWGAILLAGSALARRRRR
jgi:hypothetical protein